MITDTILHSKTRGGCLAVFLLFGGIGSCLLIGANLFSFVVGQEQSAPLWYKVSNILLLLPHTLSYLLTWRWWRWGITLNLVTSLLYYLAAVAYRGLTFWSLILALISTAVFLALVYQKRTYFVTGIGF